MEYANVLKAIIKEYMDHVFQLVVQQDFNGILKRDNVTQFVKVIMKF